MFFLLQMTAKIQANLFSYFFDSVQAYIIPYLKDNKKWNDTSNPL
jgi:hypothetical protein